MNEQHAWQPWLKVAVRVDFLAAVLLTVIAPLLLLARALRTRREQVPALLAYWRSSSLLMVAVYLLIGERKIAFPTGVAARLLIPWTLWRQGDLGDPWFARWRRWVSGYALLGALLTLPLLRCMRQQPHGPLCRAYIEPAQEFGAVLHPTTSRAVLGRVGETGLACFAVVAAWLVLRQPRG